MLTHLIKRSLLQQAQRSAVKGSSSNAVRAFTVSAARLSEAHAPSLVGPGGKPGTVPTDEDQSTGLERFQLMGKLQGVEVFDMEPLDMTHLGTKENPIVVKSLDTYRYVGCTGYPVDSHDTIWLTVEKDHEHDRCPECGSVFKLDFQGVEDHGHGHH